MSSFSCNRSRKSKHIFQTTGHKPSNHHRDNGHVEENIFVINLTDKKPDQVSMQDVEVNAAAAAGEEMAKEGEEGREVSVDVENDDEKNTAL